MAATILSAVITCAASLFLGQAALRLAGAREWNWLAPMVGLSVAMMIAAPAIYLPGRAATTAVLLIGLTLVAAVWCLRDPDHRPPLSGLLAAVPVALLVFVPFAAAGHAGTLGVSVNNDMVAHLKFVEAYLSAEVAALYQLPADYPLGPHAMAAALVKVPGVEPVAAFAGWMMAVPVIGAWTALALARRASWLGKVVAATVVGMPFLVAAYYGQGAFKEVAQAGLVLAVALLAAGYGPALGRGRWVPLALLLGGILSVYSVTGLPWPLLIVGIWFGVVACQRLSRDGLTATLSALRAQLPAIGVAAAVLFVALLPQLPRLIDFMFQRRGVAIAVDDIGNLIGHVSGWEAFGVWGEADFRQPVSAFAGGIQTLLAFAFVAVGAVWAVWRRQWVLPFAACGAMLIWAISDETQSPYVAAKALVIASPLLLALAVYPFVEAPIRRRSLRVAVAVASVGLAVLVVSSDLRALRASPVGPTAHAEELRPLRPMLAGEKVLFLGHDDFASWILVGANLQEALYAGSPRLTMRPEKAWEFGDPADFDLLEPHILNEYDWFVTTRDAAASAPPSQIKPVGQTESFLVWRREGMVPLDRSVLEEGSLAGAVLDCQTPAGRAVLDGGGVAAVRPQPSAIFVPPVFPGGTSTVDFPLSPGRWDLSLDFTSTFPLEVTAPGLDATLPPNLGRPGPRWPVGRIVVRDRDPVRIEFRIGKTPLTKSPEAAAVLGELVATPVGPLRIVPVSAACGRYVDWYRPAS